jgi:ankyrin repeat protein
MIASKNGNPDDVKALLESGADVARQDQENNTAWDLSDNAEIRTLLESYGAVAKIPQ